MQLHNNCSLNTGDTQGNKGANFDDFVSSLTFKASWPNGRVRGQRNFFDD